MKINLFNRFYTSLRNKLLIIFLLIGFLPYLLFLSYTLILSETKIVNKIKQEYFFHADNLQGVIDKQLASLQKETVFLSQLDVMTDILSDDLDKRISILLAKKSADLNLDLKLIVVNLNHSIIADSTKQIKTNKFTIEHEEKTKTGYFFNQDKLYFYAKIMASFDPTKEIGSLYLEYKLNNLVNLLSDQNGTHSYLIQPIKKLRLGSNISLNLNFIKDKDSVITDGHLIVYKKMSKLLKGWYIVYATDKELALSFLYDFVRFMLYMSPVIFFAIIFIAIRFSAYLVKPIQNLTSATDNIINTGNYSVTLNTQTQDEIAQLTQAFNNLLLITDKALKDLEEENRIRLQRFISLIKLLNSIVETKTEEECIKVSIQQMRKLLSNNDITFDHLSQPNGENINLYVSDFDHDKKIIYGSIIIPTSEVKSKSSLQTSEQNKNQHKFHQSIANMVMLQLDRIRLQDQTMSASNAKSAYISNLSHELRTPLNAIIGFSHYMISDEALNDDQVDSIASIESSAQYLLGLINNILDIAKIEAGKMDTEIQKINVADLVESTQMMLQPLAEDKGLNFVFTIEQFDIKEFNTDPKIFKQILINLLSNAIKFTPNGGVSLRLSSDQDKVKLTICDTGLGISAEDMKQLFSEFYQVEHKEQNTNQGSGLGLSISKKLANLLDGDILLESEGINQGTTAYLLIPSQVIES